MPNRFANGVRAIAMCDRCGQQYKLKNLKTEIIKQRKYELLVCPQCWDPDQPQLMLGTFPVEDPQALRNPRKDNTYISAGQNNDGVPTGGSRDIQWGWNPVGGSRLFDAVMTPNYLVATTYVGTASGEPDIALGPALSGVSSTGAVGNALGPLPITGTSATGEAGSLAVNDYPLTNVQSSAALGTAEARVSVSMPASGIQFTYMYGGLQIWIPWSSPAQTAFAQSLADQLANSEPVWFFSDASFGAPSATPVPEICFGLVSAAGSSGGLTVIVLTDQPSEYARPLPGNGAPGTNWYPYSTIRTESRFYVPCPNGGVTSSPPAGGYNPTYVDNGATCTMSWTGDAGSTLNSTYATSPSIIGSFAYASWYWTGLGGPVTMGVVTATSFNAGTSTFTITMDTITPINPGPLGPNWIRAPILFVPNSPAAYIPMSGVSSSSGVGTVTP